MKCECGSTEMKRYFHHVSKGVERYMCLGCNSYYEIQGGAIVKLELSFINKNDWKKFRQEHGFN